MTTTDTIADVIKDIERIADRLQDIEDGNDDEAEDEAQDADWEAREAIEEIARLIRAGRVDDALLTVERFLHPKHSGAPWIEVPA